LDDLDAVNRYMTHRSYAEWLVERGATSLVFNYALDDTTQILP